MATDTATPSENRPSMSVAELVAYTKKELEADAERQAHVSAVGAIGDVHSQTGVTLDLSHKNIRALPIEIIALIKDKVERLALSHNPQIAVPTQIVQCDRLRYLNIRWNQLKQFPEAVLQLSALEILDLSKNKIVTIPEEIRKMTSLKFLAVARNKITRLPLALGDMPSLSRLKFDENPIEFPPLEALERSYDYPASSIDAEKEKDTCQLVKRFLKAASLRERLKAHSTEDLSESNAETPRPPKRPMPGRFPVRPSIGGGDSTDDLRSKSPNDAPPIPLRSHAREDSTGTHAFRRPGLSPLVTAANDTSRSRSETIASTSGSLRARRQGLIAPRKATLDVNSVSEVGSISTRFSQASTVKPLHSRHTSSVSTFNGFPYQSSGGETSSGAVSPIEGPASRFGASRRLSSLPENRNSKIQSSDSVRAAKRLLFSFFQLHGPIGEVARAIKDGTPHRTMLERQLFSANAHVEELDRLLSRVDANFEDDGESDEVTARSIVQTSVAALKAYGVVTKELRQHISKAMGLTDQVYLRCLMSQIYMTSVEMRNICSILGFVTTSPAHGSTPRVSRAWSSRTVTPTQPKPVTNHRMRGASILHSMSSSTSLRTMPPPVPLSTNSTRTNTMTSMSSFSSMATPRSGETFPSLPSSTLPSRSNTMRSTFDYGGDTDDQFDYIYLKLQSACELARKSLPHCKTEFYARKESAEALGQSRAAHHWVLAINKCEAVITANSLLHSRLKVVKVKDPGLRNRRDFWQLCDAFVQSWADLATEIKDIAQQRIDITTVKTVMRPVQKAVKEVSKTISESPLYHQAVRNPLVPSSNHSFAPPIPSSVQSSFALLELPSNGTRSGYVTPLPATPLSAALGPAVQATVATPNPTAVPPEYLHLAPGSATISRAGHDRADTMTQPSGYGRR